MSYDDLHTVREACERLRIGRNKFFDLKREHKLRCIQFGRCVRVAESEIQRFIAEHATSPADAGDADV